MPRVYEEPKSEEEAFEQQPELDIITQATAGCVRLVEVREVCHNAVASFGKEPRWPSRTDAACYWCCHTFSWPPIGAPEEMDREGRFRLFGNFCSFNCAKAYLWNSNNPHKNRRLDLLMQLMLRLYGGPKRKGSYTGVVMAPPRATLKMFGGWMGIDEYRASTAKYDTFQLQEHQHVLVEKRAKYGVREVAPEAGPSEVPSPTVPSLPRPPLSTQGRTKRLHEASTLRIAMAAAHHSDVKPLDAYMKVTKRPR